MGIELIIFGGGIFCYFIINSILIVKLQDYSSKRKKRLRCGFKNKVRIHACY